MSSGLQRFIYGMLSIAILFGLVSFFCIQKNSLKNEVARICNAQTDIYTCVKSESIKMKSVKPCYLLDAGINDACIEGVYQAVGDRSLCTDIFESGIRNNCEKFFEEK